MVNKWTISFASYNAKYKLRIYDATSSSTAKAIELTGGAQPFTTDEQDDDDYYLPVRTQSGYIRFIDTDEVGDILADIMPVQSTDRPVILYKVESDGSESVMWVGFLTGEQYSQPWRPRPYQIELPVTSVMGAMEGVDFTQEDGYISIQSLVDMISGYLPIKLQTVYPSDIPLSDLQVNNDNFREYLTDKERKDQNTENIYSCSTIKEIMENFCKYFGISCREHKGTFYFLEHDTASYKSNGSDVASASYSIANLELRSASNTAGFAKFYRYVHGEFDTGGESSNETTVYEIGNFDEKFSVKDTSRGFVEFNDNDEVKNLLPNTASYYIDKDNKYLMPQMQGGIIYRNGVGYNANGGRVTSGYYDKDGWHPIAGMKASNSNDCLQITTAVATNTPTPVFRISSSKNVLIMPGDNALLNIDFSVSGIAERYGRNPGAHFGDDIDKEPQKDVKMENGSIIASIKIGDYYLSTETKTTQGEHFSSSTAYTVWTKEDSYLYFPIQGGGEPSGNYIESQDVDAYLATENNGIFISVPAEMRGKSLPIVVTLYAGLGQLKQSTTTNSEHGTSRTTPGILTDDDGKKDYDANYIHVLYSSFKITKISKTGVEDYGLDLMQNTFVVPNNNASVYHYDVASTMTTKRGNQTGTGLTIDKDKNYITTEYDLQGLKRRASIYADNHATIKATVKSFIAPIDTLTWHNKTFAILSQSVDWRNDENEVKLLALD